MGASLESPCVRNCCLDSDDVCLGCGRKLEEILQWHRASESERKTILELAKTRRENFKIASNYRHK
jgi:predicted Fe-S protein YdhL (DUF1289 family)